MALGRLTMLPSKATHPRVNEQHKLDSLGSKINEDTQLHVWGRRMGLGGVGEGVKSDQNHPVGISQRINWKKQRKMSI